MGRIIDALQGADLADDTLVIFTSDHGELLGDHGLYLKGPTHYEALLRVALVVAGPGVVPDARIAKPVSTLDLAPTLYDFAGVSSPSALQGTSLKPLLEGGRETRDVAYNEWNMQPSRAGIPLELRTVRTGTAKLTIDRLSGAGELYDLADDPMEMANRFGDPAKAALQKELEAMIEARPGPVLDALPDHEA